jgi:protein O-mannosyl-transferase
MQLRHWLTGRALLEHSLEVANGAPLIHTDLGILLAQEGDLAGAERHFAEALRLEPGYVRARLTLAVALALQDKTAEAIQTVRDMDAVWEAETHRQLAEAFLRREKVTEALEQYAAAVHLDPTNAPCREKFGLALANAGKTSEASEQFAALVELRPDAQAHYYLAQSLPGAGKPERAADHYREALRLRPDWPEALNNLAWMLATYPRADLRNAAEAVQAAERACELSGRREARFLGTLDAAYASASRFPEAITVAEETRRVALTTGDQAIADAAAVRLELYRAGRPYLQPPP